MRYRLAALFALVVVTTAACGADDTTAGGADVAVTDPPAATEPADASTTPDEAGDDAAEADGDEAAITVSSTDLGDILTDAEGATLYLFTNDEQGESTCYDDCEQNWPPLIGPAQAGEGVDEALLGTVERTDGTAQVTYNDWPLYYFAGDAAPGDTAGQGVGEIWFVVDPSGEAVREVATGEGEVSY